MNKEILTDLDAFEFVKNELLEQYTKSINEGGDCQYRGYTLAQLDSIQDEADMIARENFEGDADDIDNDLSFQEALSIVMNDLFVDKYSPTIACAAGHLIDDSLYDPDIEGKILDIQFDDCPVAELIQKSHPNWAYTEHSHKMVRRLQMIHDSKEPENWEVSFSKMNIDFDENGNFTGKVDEDE